MVLPRNHCVLCSFEDPIRPIKAVPTMQGKPAASLVRRSLIPCYIQGLPSS